MVAPLNQKQHKASQTLTIDLFGDLSEAIYQLGTLDQEDVNLAWQGLVKSSFFGPSILKGPLHKLFSKVFAKQIDRQAKLNQNGDDFYHSTFWSLIEEYARALKVDFNEALYLSFMHEFLNNPSSIFEEIDDSHLTASNSELFINSPNQEYFYEKLRFINFKTNENLNSTIPQSLGCPFAPFGGFNEAGLGLKLVQRPSLKLNYQGLSASYLAMVVLLGMDNIDEACDFLLDRELVFHWEFHLTDKNGNSRVIAIDGNVAKEIETREQAQFHTHSDLQKLYIKDHSPLSLATIEISSDQINLCLFDSSKAQINYIECTDSVKTKSLKVNKTTQSIFKIKNYLNEAQIAFNENRTEDCYHKLQLAQVYTRKAFSKNKKLNAKLTLTFLTCQYIFEDHKETYQFILKELLEIYSDLTRYDKDLTLILIQRLQILMDEPRNLIEEPSILKRIFFNESRLPKLAHIALKRTTLLRPNHLDYCPISGL